MDFLERDIEDVIEESIVNDYKSIKDRGLWLDGVDETSVVQRQFNIPNFGIADLVTFTDCQQDYNGIYREWVDVNIIELKRGVIDDRAINQVDRYKRGIEYIYSIKEVPVCVYTTLIGSGVSWGLNNVGSTHAHDIFQYKLGLRGLEFSNISMV